MKNRHKLISAAMTILVRDDTVFFIKRKNTGWEDDKFDLIAGHVEQGEKLAEAAIREAKEEANITIQKENLELVHILSLKRKDGDALYGYFVANAWEGEPRAVEAEKSAGCEWIKKSEIQNREVLDIIKQVFRHIEKGVRYSEYD